MNTVDTGSKPTKAPPIPYCNRCNHLINHNAGVSIAHPSVDSIDEIIKESPHKHNHVYHVLDAADFPMSLVKNLDLKLTLAHLRTRNRRAKADKWSGGRRALMSFIITRSDLLAPQKEQVDALLPKLAAILRKALGSFGDQVRLGDIRLVSTTRGWWTKTVKDKIWEEGGGHWLVGKVNVGKSMLYQVIFPKRADQSVSVDGLRREAQAGGTVDVELLSQPHESQAASDLDIKFSLLPPPQPDQQYPIMPIVSHLPGTTAAPIRIRFGKSRGELVDLPGLERSTLDEHVVPDQRHTLVMRSRITPERVTLRAGSSIILGGGLVRITPLTPDLVFMVHAFVPLALHKTSTAKAIERETGEREIQNLASIVEPESLKTIKSAGKFRLKTDITRAYSGPLTRKSDVGLKPDRLPFVVLATDILLEGVGWIEIVAQVRKPKYTLDESSTVSAADRLQDAAMSGQQKLVYPEVEVFTPQGKFIGQRDSIGGYALGGPKPVPVRERPSRPRRSIRREKLSREA
jgi:genetic interactor of prohibitins 3, mitochondrial